MIPAGLRSWLAFGTGVGIEIGGSPGAELLHIAVARVRRGSIHAMGEMLIDDIQHRAAAVWGADYAAFAKKHGVEHIPVTVLLPRRDVTVRQIAMPGVADKDLPAAIEFQMEGLHPYREDEAVAGWARIPGTSSVLVAITRSGVVERVTGLFAEAGIKVACVTCSAAALYAALHLAPGAGQAVNAGEQAATAKNGGLLGYQETPSGVEIYGESAARPVFSAIFDVPLERAQPLAAAEMRMEGSVPFRPLRELVGASPALPMAAAVVSACPLLALPLNILPVEQRQSSSRALWIPVAALTMFVFLLGGALGAFPAYERRSYLKTLNAEIARVQPAAQRAADLDRRIEASRANLALLSGFRSRSKADMDVLGELTRILPPPTWVNLLEIGRTQVVISGATAQAAGLLSVIDASPLFEQSEFQSAPMRVEKEETFRIRTKREAGREVAR